MARKRPAEQWYTGDWYRAVDIQKCRPATRGIWRDALDAMVNEQETGKIRGTTEQLCRLLRCSPEELQRFFDDNKEHKFANVTFRNGKVTLVCRRLHRAYIERMQAVKRMKRHREKVKRKCNGDVTPYSSTSTSTSCNYTVTYKEYSQFWNRNKNLPPIRKMTKDRIAKLKVRMNETDFAENWQKIIERIASTPFLIGDNERGWKANVDWLLANATNYVKVLEGKYDSKQAGKSGEDRFERVARKVKEGIL